MNPTLLGYDWAAAVADDSRQVGSRAYLDRKEDDLNSLSAFRRLNSSSCVGASRLTDLDSEIRDLNPKIDLNFAGENEVAEEEEEEKRKKAADSHICVFPYEIGDRLFSHPLTVGKDSSSVACPICGKGRPPPPSHPHTIASSSSSAVVKITLDRRRLLTDYSGPYIPAPKTRRSFDSSNSLSLKAHLLKGSQPLRNADIPPITRSFGLRRNLKEGGKLEENKMAKITAKKPVGNVNKEGGDSMGLRRNLRKSNRTRN